MVVLKMFSPHASEWSPLPSLPLIRGLLIWAAVILITMEISEVAALWMAGMISLRDLQALWSNFG